MFISAVGHSEDPDAQGAMDEIEEQINKSMAGQKPQAGILFAAIDFEHQQLLTSIDQCWPGLELIGCTTDGEVSSELGFSEDSVVLLLFASDTIDITAGLGEGLGKNTVSACHDAVEMASSKSDKEPALCITLPDALSHSGQLIVDSLVSKLGKSVPLIGGSAGDQWRLEKTYQFHGKRVLSDAVPVLLFSGPLEFSFSLGIGCHMAGETATVTKSKGPLLLEIDSEPAVNFYQKMIDQNATRATEIPLAVLTENGEIDYLRTPATDFDLETGSVPMFADVSEGTKVRAALMDKESLLTSCTEAGETVKLRYPSMNNPSVALLFSCAGRKIWLGTRTAEEQKALANVIDPSIPSAGFYTYGEICPSIPVEDGAKFHNHTIVVALLGERSD